MCTEVVLVSAGTRNRNRKREPAKNGAALGFEAKLWEAADSGRGDAESRSKDVLGRAGSFTASRGTWVPPRQ